MYADDDALLISGLQHLLFCERQWQLIHMENLWAENILTIEGAHLHDSVHKSGGKSRGDTKYITALRLRSSELGLYGVADMVEFTCNEEEGVYVKAFAASKKRWLPYPVEYKRGRKRPDMADEVQLCAQAICLEEMLKVKIQRGAIYYGEPKKRTETDLSPSLRERVRQLCARAEVLQKGRDKAAMNVGTHCKNCSMKDFCLPELTFADHSKKYLISLYKT